MSDVLPSAWLPLADRLGEGRIVTSQQDLEPHLREWRGRYFGKTPFMLRPKSTAEVSQILRFASERGLPVVAQGGNTGLVGGQTPSSGGDQVLLSLTGLDKVREVDAVGNTLTAEAGVTLKNVQQAAENAGRLFPLSLGSEGSCTLGGNLATNAGGVHVLRYGSARDLTLGIEAVLADGSVWNGLKRLRKDNTGYDLKNLLIGSEGTLAIITAATVRLFPRAHETQTAFAALPSLEAASLFFTRLSEEMGNLLYAFELMPCVGLEFVTRHVQGARNPFATAYPWYVLFDLSAPFAEAGLEARAERLLAAALEEGIVSNAVIAASKGQAAELWRMRELLSEVQKHEGGSIKCDVSVGVADIPAFIARASAAVEQIVPGSRPVPFGHYGDGNIHFNVSQPVGMEPRAFLEKWEEVADVVHAIVADLNGSISAEHGIGQMKAALLERIKSEVEIGMMRRIKQVLDPKGILNPGKVLPTKPASG